MTQQQQAEARVAPVPVEVAVDGFTAWRQAFAFIFHVVGTVASVVFLYVVWRGYVALGALQDALSDLSSSFAGLGG